MIGRATLQQRLFLRVLEVTGGTDCDDPLLAPFMNSDIKDDLFWDCVRKGWAKVHFNDDLDEVEITQIGRTVLRADQPPCADEVYELLQTVFRGKSVHDWEPPLQHRPGILQFRLRAREARINAALVMAGFAKVGSYTREIFWREMRKGQAYNEDAGGYVWRCWCAALGIPYREATLVYSAHFPGLRPLFEIGKAPDFDTPLSWTEDREFRTWKEARAPNDSGLDYDLRGAFKADLGPNSDGHWPDLFKKPNHPTFTIESVYAAAAPDKAGRWEKGMYVPAGVMLLRAGSPPPPPPPQQPFARA